MFIRFNSSVSGHRFAYAVGDAVEWVDNNEAVEMCARGISEEISADAAKEANKGRSIRKHVAPKENPADQQIYTEKPEMATARRAPEKMATR